MTKQGLDKMIAKVEYAKKSRELLDQAVDEGHDEDEIIELVTEDDPE